MVAGFCLRWWWWWLGFWVLGFVWVFGEFQFRYFEFQFGYWVLFGFGFELAVVVVGGAIGLLGDGWFRFWV